MNKFIIILVTLLLTSAGCGTKSESPKEQPALQSAVNQPIVNYPIVDYPITIVGEGKESLAGLVVNKILITDVDNVEPYRGKMVKVTGKIKGNMCKERQKKDVQVECFDGQYMTDLSEIEVIAESPASLGNYQPWADAKKELDKIQTIIGYNVNEYLENYAAAIELRDFYKYDEALEAIKMLPAIFVKISAETDKLQPQKDYLEVLEIKTLLKEMMELEKNSSGYLEKNIIAAKAGDIAARKENEDLYTKYYRDAMAKNRKIMDAYGKALIHGAR